MIDPNISDLFFNTEHSVRNDVRGQFEDYEDLETEAKDFLGYLDRLGVATPTAEELVADFRKRL